MKRVCFYHRADKDGHCSGAIVANHFGKHNVEMIGWNYGEEFPWDKIDKDTQVFMVDLSLQPWDKMVRLMGECKQLVWIDHHKSAIDEYVKWRETSGQGDHIVEVSTKHAACELVWNYFYGGELEDLDDDKEMPATVRLIGRYDIWEWENVPNALEFQYGLRIYDTNPENQELWGQLLAAGTMLIPRIVEEGRTILKYKQVQDKIHINSAGFELEFRGLRFLAINEMFNNSQLFDSRFDPEKHDAMLTFGYRKGKWHLGFYSPKKMCADRGIDLGAIAKELGGGGHPGAAGCQVEELPFELPRR